LPFCRIEVGEAIKLLLVVKGGREIFPRTGVEKGGSESEEMKFGQPVT